MPHPVDILAGARLRTRRKEIGISQAALGLSSGITFQQIQKYENGANRISLSRLSEFAIMLKVPISYFFEALPERIERRLKQRRKRDRRANV